MTQRTVENNISSALGETVMTEDERYEGIRHCRYADEIVRNAPWSLDDEFLTKHKIDFVAHDELPYTTGSGVDVYKELKDKGRELFFNAALATFSFFYFSLFSSLG